MTSSEEISCRWSNAVERGLKRALAGFATEPGRDESKAAVVAALTSLVEAEARTLIEKNVKLETKDGQIIVSLGSHLSLLLRDLFGAGGRVNDLDLRFPIPMPEWRKPEPEDLPHTRPYIDPRTNRPTRGHPL